MAKQRLPRRLVKLVRFLESVLDDPRASAAMKMQASGRLTELFLSAEETKVRAAIALERARARQAEAEQPTSPSAQPEATEQPDPQAEMERKAHESMKELLARYKKTA